jgi:hypothetical protein
LIDSQIVASLLLPTASSGTATGTFDILRSFEARWRNILGRYVSLNKNRNASSQIPAIIVASQSTCLQPRVCAIAPAIAGPTAPPRSGARNIRDMAEPRCSGDRISPMMDGLSTLAATAQPVRNLEKMRSVALLLKADMAVVIMKNKLAMLYTG